jgi:hypothetical protein
VRRGRVRNKEVYRHNSRYSCEDGRHISVTVSLDPIRCCDTTYLGDSDSMLREAQIVAKLSDLVNAGRGVQW